MKSEYKMNNLFYRIAHSSFIYAVAGIFLGLPSLWLAYALHSIIWFEIAACFCGLAIFGLILIIFTVDYDFARLRE